MKKFLCMLLSIVMLVGMVSNIASAASDTVKINATELDLYYLDALYTENISIPEKLLRGFQLKVEGAENVSYAIIEGESATVNEHGFVEPKLDWAYDIYGGTVDFYTSGVSIIRVYADFEVFDVTVNVFNYADRYVDELIDAFLENEIDESMTDYEKLDSMARFVASYGYSARYSSANSLFIFGEGDCWAFSNALIRVAERYGFDAWIRNAKRDPGAGSGHRNVMVQLPGGLYYQVECSYGDGYYYVAERDSLFSYTTYGTGIEVYQYDGKTMPKKLIIPQEIDGKTVLAIGDDFVAMQEGIEEVVLPDTIEYIGVSAFNSCENIKKIVLPSALESLGIFAFTNCISLVDITSFSPNFVAEDAVIYNHDKSVLLFAPAVTNFSIPNDVVKIEEYSFYYNKNINFVKIPDSVTFIGEGAFGDCSKLSVVQFEGDGLKEIDSFGFANCKNLTKIELSSSIETIGEHAFMGCYNLADIYCEAESKPEGWDENWLSDSGATVHWGYVPSKTVGDVDGNGKIEADDYIMLKRIYFGIVKPETLLNSASAELRCDVDGNGKIEADDYIMLKRAFFGAVNLG